MVHLEILQQSSRGSEIKLHALQKVYRIAYIKVSIQC